MARLTVLRIGHSTTLIDFDGDPILTDPWFSTVPIYQAGERRALDVPDLPDVAGVVISHEHYDHNDVQSLARYWTTASR